jgi:hypothetical protein
MNSKITLYLPTELEKYQYLLALLVYFDSALWWLAHAITGQIQAGWLTDFQT